MSKGQQPSCLCGNCGTCRRRVYNKNCLLRKLKSPDAPIAYETYKHRIGIIKKVKIDLPELTLEESLYLDEKFQNYFKEKGWDKEPEWLK